MLNLVYSNFGYNFGYESLKYLATRIKNKKLFQSKFYFYYKYLGTIYLKLIESFDF